MVIEALTLLQEHNVDSLPVYEDNNFIGNVSYDELMDFLNHKENGRSIYFHKLNFDLGSALILMREMRRNISKPVSPLVWVAMLAGMLLGISWWFFKPVAPVKKNEVTINTRGSDKAILTLADGKRVVLDRVKNGVLFSSDNLEIKKAKDGELVYHLKGTRSNSDATAYNTITTPNGGTYHVVLPDGTKIWMNAASSIKFPATFAAKDREVFLMGEAYFEVAKDKSHPFVVSVKGQKVDVLGTHFNVSAYREEEEVKTTLLEGSVKVSFSYSDCVILKPNQQAVLTGIHMDVKDIDPEDAIAWKNGNFVFRNESLENIMYKIARWYDVEVIYKDKEMGKQLFGGVIPRFEKISQVLNVLELTSDVHFEIKDKKVIVKR